MVGYYLGILEPKTLFFASTSHNTLQNTKPQKAENIKIRNSMVWDTLATSGNLATLGTYAGSPGTTSGHQREESHYLEEDSFYLPDYLRHLGDEDTIHLPYDMGSGSKRFGVYIPYSTVLTDILEIRSLRKITVPITIQRGEGYPVSQPASQSISQLFLLLSSSRSQVLPQFPLLLGSRASTIEFFSAAFHRARLDLF